MFSARSRLRQHRIRPDSGHMVPHFPVVWYVGDGGGAVFSKKAEPSQNILQGKATITGDRVRGEVTLNEPGDYAKVVKLTFDLPIVTEAPTAQAANPSAPH